jgi:hypothetical protein
MNQDGRCCGDWARMLDVAKVDRFLHPEWRRGFYSVRPVFRLDRHHAA